MALIQKVNKVVLVDNTSELLMDTAKQKKIPPVWLMLIVFVSLFSLTSIGITLIFNLYFFFPFPYFLGIIIGVNLLAIGFLFMISALKALSIKRAFGKEIYKPKTESRLIETGIYSYTRNPLYLGAITLFFGWFFIFLFTFLLILTLFFIILFYFVAKWEEKELSIRFGEEYQKYKDKVPFFIPHFKKYRINDN